VFIQRSVRDLGFSSFVLRGFLFNSSVCLDLLRLIGCFVFVKSGED
jgi:hypothetical protein